MPENTEICQRCKTEVSECRTLSVSCDYDLTELDLPLELIQINGQPKIQVGDEAINYGENGSINRKIFSASSDWVHRDYRFYVTRVCKKCRQDWIRSFKCWFGNPTNSDDEPILEAGEIYDREFGFSRKHDVLNDDSLDE